MAPSSSSPETSFDSSPNSTGQAIDFRLRQSPSIRPTPVSTPDVASQEAFCGFTDVEEELNAITVRASPPSIPTVTIKSPVSDISSKMAYNPPRPSPQLPKNSKKQRFQEDPDIFAPLHFDSTLSTQPEASIDSALLSELVTDTTGVSLLHHSKS